MPDPGGRWRRSWHRIKRRCRYPSKSSREPGCSPGQTESCGPGPSPGHCWLLNASPPGFEQLEILVVPIYEYKCRVCDEHFEVEQSFTDETLTEIDGCSIDESGRHQVKKVFAAPAIAFKGDGFYRNDARSSSPASTSTDASSSEKSSDKSAETSTDSSSTSDSSSGTSKSSSSTSEKAATAPSGSSSD